MGGTKLALTRVDTHGCADLEGNPVGQLGEGDPGPGGMTIGSPGQMRADVVQLAVTPAGPAAAKLGASKPRCALVTVA